MEFFSTNSSLARFVCKIELPRQPKDSLANYIVVSLLFIFYFIINLEMYNRTLNLVLFLSIKQM